MSEGAIRYAVQGLTGLLKLVVGRGRVKSADDTGNVQILQVQLSPKELANLRRLAEFGFTSLPMDGADAVAVFVGGDRSNGVIIATGDQHYRFKLGAPGEVAIYDAFGKSIWLKKDGGVVLEAAGADVAVTNAADVTVQASGTVTLEANVHITGNLVVDGTIGDSVRTLEADRAIYDTHTHPVTGAVTGVPNQHE